MCQYINYLPNQLMINNRVQQVIRINLPNGYIYEGSIVNNNLHGEGFLYSPNSKQYIYRGNWAFGARNGYGHYRYPDGSQYTGDWKNNLKQGKGVYKNKAGQKYEGQWMQNRRHGNGKLELRNGVIMSGNWVNDQITRGQIIYPDGSIYEGSLKQYGRNGPGTYIYADKSQYSGNWVNNTKHGQGQFHFPNGDYFSGWFVDNLKHGPNSKYVWKDLGYTLNNAYYNKGIFQNGQLIRN